MPVFRSRVDSWLILLVLTPMALALWKTGTLVFQRPDGEAQVAFVVSVLAIAFLAWTFLDTKYVIEGESLRVQSGPFRSRIAIATIRRISPSSSLLAAPALSLRRLEIDYGKYDTAIVSPKDQSGFIAALQAINPAIELREFGKAAVVVMAVLVSGLLLAPSQAQAQDELLPTASTSWVLIAESNRDAVRMDTTRLIDYGDYVGVWLLLQRRRALRDASGRDLRGSAFFEELDCPGLRSRRWEIHALGPLGNVVDTAVVNSSAWIPFTNHPVGQPAMLKACELLASIRR